MHRFVGVSLSGGKADKTCVAILEYYPEHGKVFLSGLFERIKSENEISADLKLYEIIDRLGDSVDYVALDAPISLPRYFAGEGPCPAYENSKDPEIEWMWAHTREHNKKKKPKRFFTPYTQRAIELYLATELEEPFLMQQALGANTAPLTARAHYIKRRLHAEVIEVFPKLSIWRIGRSLKVSKSHLRFHKHAVGGDESRLVLLKALADYNVAFMYHQDFKTMVDNNHAFEAFICGLTAYLKFRKQNEPRPSHFPADAAWIEFPQQDIQW